MQRPREASVSYIGKPDHQTIEEWVVKLAFPYKLMCHNSTNTNEWKILDHDDNEFIWTISIFLIVS